MITNVVTGAFGYSGKYMTRRLLAMGERVITLTNRSPTENPYGEPVKIAPLQFADPSKLAANMVGATTLYNTYWVRFDQGNRTHEAAVENTQILVRAAKQAGVRRIVHISITNPSLDSSLPYFRGKAILEQFVRESGLEYTILRPTVIFGREDILMNNIAYFLRRLPIFAIPGNGGYRLQPIFAEDLAELAVESGHARRNEVIDAVGPEIYTFNELVLKIRDTVHSRAKLLHVPARFALACATGLGYLLRDVVITRDEVTGLMADILVSAESPRGRTKFSQWLRENADAIGTRYASELARHYRGGSSERVAPLGFVA